MTGEKVFLGMTILTHTCPWLQQQESKKSPPLYLCLHVCMKGSVLSILEHMMDILRDSGVLEAVKEYWIGGCGDASFRKDIEQLFPSKTKIKWIAFSPDVAVYERLTLHALHDMAQKVEQTEQKEFHVLYMHSKGVSRNLQMFPGVPGWRSMMMYYLCTYFPKCVDLLSASSGPRAVGVMKALHPQPHFSGNFWWTTASTLRHLFVPIGNQYLDPEMWIGQNGTELYSVYQHPQWKCIFSNFDRHLYENQWTEDIWKYPKTWHWKDIGEKTYYGRSSTWICLSKHVLQEKLHQPHQHHHDVTTIVIQQDIFYKNFGKHISSDPCPQQKKMWMIYHFNFQRWFCFVEGEYLYLRS